MLHGPTLRNSSLIYSAAISPSSRSSANLIRDYSFRPVFRSSSSLLPLHPLHSFFCRFSLSLLRLSLLLTDWARYLLPAATAAKLKARTRVHFLRAAFYTVHYNARACTHYTVPRDSLPADPAGLGLRKYGNYNCARDLWCPVLAGVKLVLG